MLRFLVMFVSQLLLAVPQISLAKAQLPDEWPKRFELGMRDNEGGAAQLRSTTELSLRYHYLSGGVNTGDGWQRWAQGNGSFVNEFVTESRTHNFIPVFSFYQLWQSAPGNKQSEMDGIQTNLRNKTTMRAYFLDLKTSMERAHDAGGLVVLHVEPDLWGYMQRSATRNTPESVPVAVAKTGINELAGLPNNARGFARAIVRLRDQYGQNVKLAYHLSVWGTGVDLGLNDPALSTVPKLAADAVTWFRSLQTRFDFVFAEYTDRDAGYRQHVDGKANDGFWDAADFQRHIVFLSRFHKAVKLPMILWQIPLGNTVMRAMNDTPYHYRDNRVQWLLGDDQFAHLRQYRRVGVVALLFGKAQEQATCACDDAKDGVTNPEPLTGGLRLSLNADDDGGYFRERAKAYYGHGALSLPTW